MKEKSHYFLSSIGVILAFLCGVGCTSNKTQDSYDGTLDAQTLGTEIAPCIMKVDAIQSAKEKITIAVLPTETTKGCNFNPNIYAQQLRATLAQYANGEVTYIHQSVKPKFLRRKARTIESSVSIEKLTSQISKELLAFPSVKDNNIVLSMLYPSASEYSNVDIDTYLKSLRQQIMQESNNKIKFALPGKVDKADYILSSLFIGVDEKTDHMRVLGDTLSKTNVTPTVKNVAKNTKNKSLQTTTKKTQKAPRFIRRTRVGENETLAERKTEQSTPISLAKQLNILLVDTKSHLATFEKDYSLRDAIVGTNGANYLLKTTVKTDCIKEHGKFYVTLTMSLINPDANNTVVWEGEYKTQFIPN